MRVSHSTLDSVDLKTIEGVCSREILVQAPCPRLEDLATAEVCRGVRIISYKDFVKALSLALPRFTNGDSIRLRQAAWHGERLFWAGERQACAFAAAIVYASPPRTGTEAAGTPNATNWSPARWTNWNSATTCCGFRPRPGPSRPS
ncbi:hypothetical protein P4203_21650 [Pseudomonas aeruginosa]|nr:hypothetical protein [Pseudomonas aeruginosa]